MQSLVLNDKIEAVESLLVDTKTGGIGFRNHTVPAIGFENGVFWNEDILFVEPETVCVNTNTTLDFEIAPFTSMDNSTGVAGFTKPVLTDRGGFVNIKQEFPQLDHSNAHRDPKLRDRAYKAA